MKDASRKQTWNPSQFNEYLGDLSKDNWVIYNNLSGAMIEIERELYDAVLSRQLESLSKPEHIRDLTHGKIIVPVETDEVEALRKVKGQHIKDVTAIGLQILPCVSCNFSCPYCYQQPHGQPRLMSQEVMDAIIDHLEKKAAPTTRFLSVMWYGGEPLLAIDRIQYLSHRFLEIVQAHNLKYFGAMISNGYLLTKKNIGILLENKITFCQVTVDGPEHIHDSRRMLKNGGKTWRTIIDNVKQAVSADMKVTIRMNIDKVTIDTVEEFVEALRAHDLLNRVGVSFGLVTIYGNACRSIEDTLLTLPTANSLLEKKNIKALLNKKKEKVKRAMPDFIGCVATARHSVIVGPEGELYKCSKNVGDKNEQCGTIFQFDELQPNFRKWEDCNNFGLKLCRRCSMLPICHGTGCAFDCIIKKENIFDCDKKEKHKKHIQRLISIYLQNKHSNAKNKNQKKEETNEGD